MFRFSLKHERQYVDGTSYHFTSDDSWNEITSYLAQQFPQGKLTDSTKWELASAAIPVVVFSSSVGEHEYVATRQVATVGAVNGEGGVEFAYPSGADTGLHFDDGIAVEGVSYAELVEYYKGLAGVEIVGSDIVIPASEGTVILRESGLSPTFTRGN